MITDSGNLRQMSDELVDLHLAHLQAGGKSHHTIAARRSVLLQLHGRLPYGLAYAATEQIEAWLADLRTAGRSGWTLHVYAFHTFGFFKWATVAGFLDGDPTATIEKPRHPRTVPKPVTEDELAKALQLPEPYATAAVLAGFEGLRAGEIAACYREHITEEVTRVPRGKGGYPGVVPTHPFVWQWIRRRPEGPLVPDYRGRQRDGHWLTVSIRPRFDQAGLPEVHLHRLRHRFGTVIQQNTGNIRVTQECMRHLSITSTQGYTLVPDDQRAAAVAALPVPWGPPAGQ